MTRELAAILLPLAVMLCCQDESDCCGDSDDCYWGPPDERGARALLDYATRRAILASCGYEPCSDHLLPETSYERTLDEWGLSPEGDPQGCGLPRVIEGSCSGGRRFVYFNGGFGVQVRYFEADRLVGVASSSDFLDAVCNGAQFGPSLSAVKCIAPTGRYVCDGSLVEPDSLFLPYANVDP